MLEAVVEYPHLHLQGFEVVLNEHFADIETGPHSISIRPTAFRVDKEKPAIHTIKAKVIEKTFLGDHVEYQMESDIGPLFIVDYSLQGVCEIGSSVYLMPNVEGIAIVGMQANAAIAKSMLQVA